MPKRSAQPSSGMHSMINIYKVQRKLQTEPANELQLQYNKSPDILNKLVNLQHNCFLSDSERTRNLIKKLELVFVVIQRFKILAVFLYDQTFRLIECDKMGIKMQSWNCSSHLKFCCSKFYSLAKKGVSLKSMRPSSRGFLGNRYYVSVHCFVFRPFRNYIFN